MCSWTRAVLRGGKAYAHGRDRCLTLCGHARCNAASMPPTRMQRESLRIVPNNLRHSSHAAGFARQRLQRQPRCAARHAAAPADVTQTHSSHQRLGNRLASVSGRVLSRTTCGTGATCSRCHTPQGTTAGGTPAPAIGSLLPVRASALLPQALSHLLQSREACAALTRDVTEVRAFVGLSIISALEVEISSLCPSRCSRGWVCTPRLRVRVRLRVAAWACGAV